MNEEIKQLQEQVVKLTQRLDSLQSSTTIPFDVDRAFRDRFRDITGLSVSSKNLDSEDQAVNEGGASTYSVMGDPDGFLQITISNVAYYIPYFN